MNATTRLIKDEIGIQHAEEAVLLAGFVVALVTALQAFKGGLVGAFTYATSKIATSV